MEEWREIHPSVNNCAEFYEIASDFGDPLELVREAISNAYDAKAKTIKINFSIQKVAGYDKLVIELEDDGNGMTRRELEENFWALGNSGSREDPDKIGEKGHGTKIYLRSNSVYVCTSRDKRTYESICENAFSDLCMGKLHCPKTREIEYNGKKGTYIKIIGYNDSTSYKEYRQDTVKDYIYWFTKLGSFEKELPDAKVPDFCVELHCLNRKEEPYYEHLEFGHHFPEENCNAETLFEEHEGEAADYFVKRYEFFSHELPNYPYISFDALIYVEGNKAKKSYNKMIKNKSDRRTGVYKVSDRYGLYLCKDYIPIQQINNWIVGFGTGSNSATLLHGFINCQNLNLTANRGTIANTDLGVIRELKEQINELLDDIHSDLYRRDFGILQQFKSWEEEEKTKRIEEVDFQARKDRIKKRKYFEINDQKILEPSNESELFGLLMTMLSTYPKLFQFEPLDYNTTRGIDIVARNKSNNKIADCEYWYVELKYILSKEEFNHSFSNIRWIVCWELSKELKDGTILLSKISDEKRVFSICNIDGTKHYYLDDAKGEALTRIKVMPLKEILVNKLEVQIHNPD